MSCYFCDENHEEYDYDNCIYKEHMNYIMSLETIEWNDYYDCFNCITTEVNYCPMCGRKL